MFRVPPAEKGRLVTITADTRTAVQVRPVAGYTGADISGVDLSRPLSAEEIAQIQDALYQYKVIFFRDQFLTHAQQVQFGAQFGKQGVHTIFLALEDSLGDVIQHGTRATITRASGFRLRTLGFRSDLKLVHVT